LIGPALVVFVADYVGSRRSPKASDCDHLGAAADWVSWFYAERPHESLDGPPRGDVE
jgi:hypothetical protein